MSVTENQLAPSLRWMIDRSSIQDRVVRTCVSLDERDWSAYLNCFTRDATISYSHKVGDFTPQAFVEQVVKAAPEYAVSQHLALNLVIDLLGLGATCRTQVVSYFGPLGKLRHGNEWRMASAVYRDQLERSGDGWRIRKRCAEVQWTDGPSGE